MDFWILNFEEASKEALKRALKRKHLDRVKDSRGESTRAYHLGKNLFASATEYETESEALCESESESKLESENII